MQITTCLLVLFNQSGAESCLLVSSLSAYEHLYFDLDLFESDLPLKFLSYLDAENSLFTPQNINTQAPAPSTNLELRGVTEFFQCSLYGFNMFFKWSGVITLSW